MTKIEIAIYALVIGMIVGWTSAIYTGPSKEQVRANLAELFQSLQR